VIYTTGAHLFWSGALASVMHEARQHTAEALRVLLKLMRSAASETVRLNAAETLLSRGWAAEKCSASAGAYLKNRREK
jgi:hypothetical protein